MKGELYKQAFDVEIGRRKSVANLKDNIKEKQKPNFDHIPASSLVLWKISIPYDQNLAKNVDILSLVDDGLSPQAFLAKQQIQSLSPVDELSKLFPEPPIEKHVHIIVGAVDREFRMPEAKRRRIDDEPDVRGMLFAEFRFRIIQSLTTNS